MRPLETSSGGCVQATGRTCLAEGKSAEEVGDEVGGSHRAVVSERTRAGGMTSTASVTAPIERNP